MGQPIAVTYGTVEDVLLITADRSITGQDGVAYGSAAEADADPRFPGDLAGRLFASEPAIDHIFVGSNQVVVRRLGGWDDGSIASATGIVEDFFLYYRPGD
jgi:hypothetical protein